MDISESQIEFKKKVGHSKGEPVYHLKTTGGLHLIAKVFKSGKNEILAMGPHRGVARHIASKYDPDVSWTELSKADHFTVDEFEHLLPEYVALTEQARKTQGE
jgi:hypothetical protein